VLSLGVLAGAQIAYLVAANVLLRTGLLRAAVNGSSVPFALGGRSSDLRLDYRSAYSWLPGRVHVEGLVMRGRDETVEWHFSLDRADVAISLPDLLRRTFHATRVRASGFAIQARLRLEPGDVTPEVVAALPVIAGFSDPPLVNAGPSPPPLSDAEYDLWAVHLEDVDLEHAREVWIHTIRARGDTRVRGRWLFRPQRWLDVGPALVDANGVDFSYGSEVLAKGVRSSAGATVHPFDLRQVQGLAILDHVSYDGRLRGLAMAGVALGLLTPRSGIRFKTCDLPFDAHLALVDGKVAVGTRVQTVAASCGVETQGLTLEGPVRTDLTIAGDLASLHVGLSAVRVSQRGAELAHVTSIATTLTSSRLQLTNFLSDANFSVDVDAAETSNIGAWHDFFPSDLPFSVRSGSVTGSGHADGSVAQERGRATIQLSARRLGVERDRDRLSADGAVAHLNVRSAILDDETFDVSGSDVALSAVSAASSPSKAAFLAVPTLRVTAPRFTLAPSGIEGHVAVDVPRADLLDLRRLNGLLPASSVIRVERGSGRAKLRVDVELGTGAMRGDAEVVAHGIRVRVGSSKFSGDFSGNVRAQRAGAAAGSTDFSGSRLALSRVSTAALPEAAWWTAVTLNRATLRTSDGARFDASVQLTAKDATPATVVVAQNSGVPTWAANIFRMPGLTASAQVTIRPASVEVRSLVARGGGASVRAEYTKRDGRQDGALLLDLGWIDLGYDLADGATGFVLLGPHSWFGRKVASMRGVAGQSERESDARQLARYTAWSPTERQSEARELATQCARARRSCDDRSIDNLLRASGDTGERATLGGTIYAPLLEAAAKRGSDGATLDPLVVGSSAEALKLGGGSTLDHVPVTQRALAVSNADAARGKVMTVRGQMSPLRAEGPYFVGSLTTDAGPVYIITPFAVDGGSEELARFRGVFVQWYEAPNLPPSQAPSLVLVGAFAP
jgi:hypothetical protein